MTNDRGIVGHPNGRVVEVVRVPVPFGPRLIGETEKTLNALLQQLLEPTGLTEPQWVTLRLADHLDGGVGGLAAAVADRAHFRDAADLVDGLTGHGLLDRGRLTPAGRELTTSVQRTIDTAAAPIWADLPADDVLATTRVLNEVITRARTALRSIDLLPRRSSGGRALNR